MHICISNPSVFHSSSRETNIIAPGQRALINSTSAKFSVVSALHECNQTQLGTEKLPVVIACYDNLCNRMLPDTLGPHQPYNGRWGRILIREQSMAYLLIDYFWKSTINATSYAGRTRYKLYPWLHNDMIMLTALMDWSPVNFPRSQ